MCMPFSQVSHSGVEEFLWKCKLFRKLNSDLAAAAALPSAAESSKAAEAVLAFRLQHNVGVAKKANEAAGKTADVANYLSAGSVMLPLLHNLCKLLTLVHLGQATLWTAGLAKGGLTAPLTDANCWLEVEVKWVDEEEPTWVAATSLLQGNRDVLGSWVKSVNEVHSIPQPGGKHAEEPCACLESCDAQSGQVHNCWQGSTLLFSRLLPSPGPPSKFVLACWQQSLLKVDGCSSWPLRA